MQRGIWHYLLVCVFVAVLGLMPQSETRADVGAWTSNGPGENVTTLAVNPVNDIEVYAAGESGVWKTTNGGNSWSKISSQQLSGSLVLDPQNPMTLYSISKSGTQIVKSTNGGVDWLPIYPNGTSGSLTLPVRMLAADPSRTGVLYAVVNDSYRLQVLKTVDAGTTWSELLPPELTRAPGGATSNVYSVGALVVSGSLIGLTISIYHGGFLLLSRDAGQTWQPVSCCSQAYLAGAYALAIAKNVFYVGTSLMGSGDLMRSTNGGASWTQLGAQLPAHTTITSMIADPVQETWLYMVQFPADRSAGTPVWASADGGEHWYSLGALPQAVHQTRALALARQSHTLYAATDRGIYQYTIAWPVAPRFKAYYDAHDGYRVLGTAISLESVLGRIDGTYAVQYFEKGRMEDRSFETSDPNWQIMYGLLVDQLVGRAGENPPGSPYASASNLPVGGDVSSMTYYDLVRLRDPAQRVAPPPGYPGFGTMTLANGTTFIPFTADLSAAPGHYVLGGFWQYMNRADLFPGGWLHDIGLPITEPQEVHVTKYLPEGPVQRQIIIQAFQRTVLTYDPANPPAWQIERANVGSDFRKAFPGWNVGP